MPWRELSAMDQREEFVRLALSPGANKRELCRRFGISHSKGYKWLGRYALEGRSGLADRFRRPRRSPTRTAQAVEAEVLRVRAESNNAWGGRKIAQALKDEGAPSVPAASTITQILRRHGKLEQSAHEHPGPYQRFEREQPNELWQMDFKGDFAMARGRCYPLTIVDDHSRYALGVEACATQQDLSTRQRLIAVFCRYGLPDAILMDNGSPWGDSGGGRFTAFSLWLLRLGVWVTHGRPYHPQTQGKDERFHRTLNAEVLRGRQFVDLAECQHAFDAWRHRYNHVRPHQALAMTTPGTRYRPSRRSYSEALPPIEYAPDDLVRKADKEGDISFKGRRIRLGRPFRHQPVALRPTAQDGVFSIHFCTHQIDTLDLREEQARGLVDNAKRRCPQDPQAQQQKTQDRDETRI